MRIVRRPKAVANAQNFDRLGNKNENRRQNPSGNYFRNAKLELVQNAYDFFHHERPVRSGRSFSGLKQTPSETEAPMVSPSPGQAVPLARAVTPEALNCSATPLPGVGSHSMPSQLDKIPPSGGTAATESEASHDQQVVSSQILPCKSFILQARAKRPRQPQHYHIPKKNQRSAVVIREQTSVQRKTSDSDTFTNPPL